MGTTGRQSVAQKHREGPNRTRAVGALMTVVGPQWQHGGSVLNSRLFFFSLYFSWGFEGRLRRGGGVGRWDTTKEELGVRSCLMGAAKSRHSNREVKSWHVCDNGSYQSTSFCSQPTRASGSLLVILAASGSSAAPPCGAAYVVAQKSKASAEESRRGGETRGGGVKIIAGTSAQRPAQQGFWGPVGVRGRRER